ncbi:MAG: hypothetical protein Q9182_006542 [Xanthomendoza sp. 2 TL-2023]
MREAVLKEPVPSRTLSTREQIILLESSRLHGCLFPPWRNPPETGEFEIGDDQSLFIDPNADFRLSQTQLALFDGWKRPEVILPSPGPMMTADESVDLVQDVTSDCSVVASLCASSARAEKGHSAIFSSIFYPYDSVCQQPVRSRNGKYVFRLHFNGCWRKVVIDDRLPASKEDRAIFVLDRNNPSLLWPALVEKAYLKIRGGYDFPGSNSGSDLWVLTGWIPEQLFLQSEEIDREALWRRIFKAFSYGDVLITLGTGNISGYEERHTGLNPWSKGGGWTASAREYPEYPTGDPTQRDRNSSATSRENSRDGSLGDLEPGAFWMSINDIFQQFESLYLNWNPGLFSYKEDTHFSWDLTRRDGQWASLAGNPQYRIHSEAGGMVWLVLSRHLKSSDRITGQAEKDLSASASDTGFISIYLYHEKSDKVYLTNGNPTRSPYVDSLNTLLKVELLQDARCTVVISEQELHRSSHSFTLSTFSLHPLSISEAQDRYRNRTIRSGEWTSTTAGGNSGSPCHFQNPQFKMDLRSPSDVSLLLELDSGELPVHVKLMRTNGTPVRFVMNCDIVGDSGHYRKGHAFAEIYNVPAGRYTIICSTFEQGQLGKFTLQVGTMLDCAVARLSTRPAGRFVSRLPTAVFGAQVDRLWASVKCSRITRLSVVAQSHGVAAATNNRNKPRDVPLKVSLELGQGPMKRTLAVSGDGEFGNGYYGAQFDDVDVQPSMCSQVGTWIVLERAGPLDSPSQESVDVEMYSDTAIEIGSWYHSP